MPGPATPQQALAIAKLAITSGQFVASDHFKDRMVERKVDMLDVHNAIDRSFKAVAYRQGQPRNGGTCWRVLGPDCDGERTIAIGIEVYRSKANADWMVLCTVMEKD